MMSCFKYRSFSQKFFCIAILNTTIWSLAVGSLCSRAEADWPSLLGTNRDGKADADCKLPDSIADGLEPEWSVDIGQGYAGPAVAGNELALFDRVGANDCVRMINASTGDEIWKKEIPTKYEGGVDSDKGPRCVPTITATTVLVYSATGNLMALARKDGTTLWSRKLYQEFQADEGYFGAGSTPLVVGDKVVVNVGGKKANVVCVSMTDGKDLWTSSKGDASYASPIYLDQTRNADFQKPVVVVPTRLATFGIDIESGTELWKVPFGQRGPTVNAATPIVTSKGGIFLTASYGIGSLLLNVDSKKAEVERMGDELSSQYATPVSIGGYLFGSDGREDHGLGSYRCWDEVTGTMKWEKLEMPISHSIGVQDRVLVCGIDGQIWCLDTNAEQFAPVWKTKLAKGVYRAIPALSGNRLFLRTSQGNKSTLSCYSLE